MSPFQLYFNPTLIVLHYQVWRLITTFLFFGTIGFNFLFNMTFTYRYCRMLEEGSFRGKSSDFIMMFIFGGALMIVSSHQQCNWTKKKPKKIVLNQIFQSFTHRFSPFSWIFYFWDKHLRSCWYTYGLDETHSFVWISSASWISLLHICHGLCLDFRSFLAIPFGELNFSCAVELDFFLSSDMSKLQLKYHSLYWIGN